MVVNGPVNVAVIGGTLSSDPEIRTLPSGERLATLQVTVRCESAPTTSVPVACAKPPAWLDRAVAGDGIVAVGPVRRRYFRAGGGSASRTEVAAAVVARARERSPRRRTRAAHRRAVARMRSGTAQRSREPGAARSTIAGRLRDVRAPLAAMKGRGQR